MIVPISTLLSVLFLFLLTPNLFAAKSEQYGGKICAKDPLYKCYVVKRGDTWEKLYDDPETRDLVMRINRTNQPLISGMKIAVPADDNRLDLIDYAPFAKQISPPGNKVIFISLQNLAFAAYSADGELQFWGPVSGGKNYCGDIRRGCRSPVGHFSIFQKGGFSCASSKYPVGRGGAPMPYCMHFYKGYALHGSYNVPGYNASHGCIRLFVNDAKWLNKEFTAGEYNVAVIIKRTEF